MPAPVPPADADRCWDAADGFRHESWAFLLTPLTSPSPIPPPAGNDDTITEHRTRSQRSTDPLTLTNPPPCASHSCAHPSASWTSPPHPKVLLFLWFMGSRLTPAHGR